MNDRDEKNHFQMWLILGGIFVYAVGAVLIGDGNPFAVHRLPNMRIFLPTTIVVWAILKNYRPKPPPPHRHRERPIGDTGTYDNYERNSAAAPMKTAIEEPPKSVEQLTIAANPESASAVIVEAVPLPAPTEVAIEESPNINWMLAQKKPHSMLPRYDKDSDYLELVGLAAREGCVDAQVAMGMYAYMRGHVVEEYFWYSLANDNSGGKYSVQLDKIAEKWMDNGCPENADNVRADFGVDCGNYARALLNIRFNIDVRAATAVVNDIRAGWNAEGMKM